MKLLDFPPSICENVNVTFHTEDWHTFDKTCEWLVKEGVPLTWNSKHIQIKHGHAYAEGRLVNVTHSEKFGYARGEEASAEYTVYCPRFIRT